jgi:hypothetical protein
MLIIKITTTQTATIIPIWTVVNGGRVGEGVGEVDSEEVVDGKGEGETVSVTTGGGVRFVQLLWHPEPQLRDC